jgi:hypothetical protein
VTAGTTTRADDLLAFSAVAFTPGGAPDTAFGGAGTGGVVFGPEGALGDVPSAIVQQSDGSFVVAGSYSTLIGNGIVVGRLTASGTPDPSFGVDGAVAPNPPYAVLVLGGALSGDGQLLISGAQSGEDGSEAYLGKLTLDVPPTLAFTALPAAPLAGQPVTFTATASDASSTPSVSWDLGSGTFGEATGLTATKTFASAGTYTIRAQATDADHQSTVQTQTVTVGPAPAATTTTTTPTTTTTTPTTTTVTVPAALPASECTSSLTPTTTVRSKLLLSRGLELAGTSAAHCPSSVTSVGIAIARVKQKKCSFLSGRHRWGKYGSCTPTAYLPASGTYSWAVALKRTFARGRYWVWEHAIDNAGVATANTAAKHITFTLRGAHR